MSYIKTKCLSIDHSLQVNMDSSTVSHGILRTKEEQDEYETKWHTRIYTPGWNDLHSKVKTTEGQEVVKRKEIGGKEGEREMLLFQCIFMARRAIPIFIFHRV